MSMEDKPSGPRQKQFQQNFAALRTSFKSLPIGGVDRVKEMLSNAIQKDNVKRIGFLQFSRFIGETMCKMLREGTMNPLDYDFEILKRMAIILFYAPFASTSSEKTGSSLPAQSIFDEKEFKVFKEIENWKSTTMSTLTVTTQRPLTDSDVLSSFGKEVKGMVLVNGEFRDLSEEVAHHGVLAYAYLLATKAQNFVKHTCSAPVVYECVVPEALSDVDEVSMFYMEYYQLLSAFDIDNAELEWLMKHPDQNQAIRIASFFELEVALRAAKQAQDLVKNNSSPFFNACGRCSSVFENALMIVAFSAFTNAIELLEPLYPDISSSLGKHYAELYDPHIKRLKTEAYEFLGNSIKFFYEGKGPETRRSLTDQQMEDLIQLCDTSVEWLRPQLFNEFQKKADDKPDTSSEELPELETVQPDHTDKRFNHKEKKMRKAMQKEGLKVVSGITRVTLRHGKDFLYSIENPDVYEGPNHTYVIFGYAKLEDLRELNSSSLSALANNTPIKPTSVVEEPAEDSTGISEQDITLVMSHSDCSRARAIKALKESNGDIVNAVMSLSN